MILTWCTRLAGPTTITNISSVENLGGLDIDDSNNAASVDTEVVAAADLEIVDFAAVNPPAQIVVGESTSITLRTTLTNHGPSGPMDMVLNSTATAPPDSSVTPTSANTVVPALGLGEQRVVEEIYSVQCDGFSQHTFTFATGVQPFNMEDTDPDLSNNQAEITLNIECVVPVAIDIIPKQINLNGNGVVPVLVLTTRGWGEWTPTGIRLRPQLTR